jgi:hypothetical protein
MRLTRPGAVVIAILVACGVVLVVAHGAAQFVAAAVGLVVLLLLAGEGLGSGYAGDARRKREVLGRQARRRKAPIADDELEQPVSGLVSRRRRDPG